MLSVLVPILRRDGELDLANAEAALLFAVTASTIDRRLAGERAKMMPRGRSHTKPGSLLKSQIPIDSRSVPAHDPDAAMSPGLTTEGSAFAIRDCAYGEPEPVFSDGAQSASKFSLVTRWPSEPSVDFHRRCRERFPDEIETAAVPVERIRDAILVAGGDDQVWFAETVRGVLGPDRDFAIDFHGRVSPANAKRMLAALEPTEPMFVEEPVLPEFGHRVVELVAGTTIPLALGERLFSRTDFLPALQAGIAVVQPDLSHAGGISESRRIAALAETFGAAFAPHCPLGPIALAACLQVDFATPNFLVQEQSLGIHYNQGTDLLDYLVDPDVFEFRDGYLARPTGPGLGITIDEAAVRRADKVGHSWRGPIWRHEDGGFAEW